MAILEKLGCCAGVDIYTNRSPFAFFESYVKNLGELVHHVVSRSCLGLTQRRIGLTDSLEVGNQGPEPVAFKQTFAESSDDHKFQLYEQAEGYYRTFCLLAE